MLEVDLHGHLLRYVWLADGTLVNELLALYGYAKAVTDSPDVKYQDRFLRAQLWARGAGVGLWGSATQIDPAAAALPYLEMTLVANDSHWDNRPVQSTRPGSRPRK